MGRSVRLGDFDAIADPYCYPDITVLRNIPDIRDADALAEFEAVSTAQRADEPLPEGRLSIRHYRAIHHHLFQDVYAWAGKFRTVRLGKDGNAFCYPENIAREMQRLFADLRRQRHLKGLQPEAFAAAAAHFLATLNAIHPFREGNGRTQISFLTLLADRADHPVNLDRLAPERFLDAMIESFHGNEQSLMAEVRQLIDR
jgi:cell filamentation protein